jgi:hypothetical protein
MIPSVATSSAKPGTAAAGAGHTYVAMFPVSPPVAVDVGTGVGVAVCAGAGVGVAVCAGAGVGVAVAPVPPVGAVVGPFETVGCGDSRTAWLEQPAIRAAQVTGVQSLALKTDLMQKISLSQEDGSWRIKL